MSSLRWMSLMRNATILSATVACAVGLASAQSAPSYNPSSAPAPSASESSSAAMPLVAENDAAPVLPAAPSPAAAGAGQGGGGYQSHSLTSHLAIEVGGGVNAPSSESSKYITWGGNFTLGGGYKFNNRFTVLAEYQFIDDKLPGAFIAQTGAQGGNAHIWSFTLAPVVDLMPTHTNSVYVTGGGGFYRKVTNFTNPQATQYCYYFYCGYGTTNVVVGHFSSNQGGWNIGGGFTHRLGGMYGEGRMKLFAEARYLEVLSPALTTNPNGLGTTTVGKDTKVIPVTFGIRW